MERGATLLMNLISSKSKSNTSTFVVDMAKCSAFVLLLAMTFVTCRQNWGEPITCAIGPGNSISVASFQTHCLFARYKPFSEIVSSEENKKDTDKFTNIFHVIYLILLVQTFLFCLPWVYSRCSQGDEISDLVEEVKKVSLLDTTTKVQVKKLSKYLIRNKGWYNTRAKHRTVAQLLCLVLGYSQLIVMQMVMGRGYSEAGQSIPFFEAKQVSSALENMFPSKISCKMQYSSNNGIKTYDWGLCFFPYNIAHQWLYFGLFYWLMSFIILAFIFIFWDFYHIASNKARLRQLRLNVSKEFESRIPKKVKYGDFVVLTILCKSLTGPQFDELLQYIEREEEEDVSEESLLDEFAESAV